MQPFLQCSWQLNEKQFTPLLALNFHNHITLTFQVPHFKLSKAHNLRHLPSSRVYFSPHPCRDGYSKGRSGTAVPLCQAQKILLCVKVCLRTGVQTPSFTLMTRSLTPEVLLLVLREPSPYQRHTSPQFVRPRPAVSQNVIPAVAKVTFLTRDAPSSFILQPHTARRRLHFKHPTHKGHCHLEHSYSLPPSYQMHLPLTMGTLQ